MKSSTAPSLVSGNDAVDTAKNTTKNPEQVSGVHDAVAASPSRANTSQSTVPGQNAE